MYDKQVRRRRAVLALLVVVSLILLTAYFGESAGGPFHAIQRGVVQVLSPVQEGASRALKPARDLFGWVGDTFRAKSQRDQLKKQVAQLSAELHGYEIATRDNAEIQQQAVLNRSALNGYNTVRGRIISRATNNLFQDTITIDVGSSDGVRLFQPVTAGGALVGKVTTVTSGTSIVTLISDQSSAVSVWVLSGKTGKWLGLLRPSLGNPTDLLVQNLDPNSQKQVQTNDQVVTSGSVDGKDESLYPPDIPVGTVSRASQQMIADTQQIHVSPAADLRHLSFVYVATGHPSGTGQRAQVP